MKKALSKATTLVEALPYIRAFNNKTVVIKFGGNAMVDSSLNHSFALDVILLSYVGIRVVIVHGGGPQIGDLMQKLGKQSTFQDGLRVTDPETMEIVEMVLMGKINKQIVTHINRNGGKAVGLSGKDGNLISAKKLHIRDKADPERLIDIGLVGEITGINPTVIDILDSQQFIPVIAPVGMGADGTTYNVNADTAAGEIATALRAEKLILLTDIEGVKDAAGNLRSTLRREEIRGLIECGEIGGGMIPKLTCCCKALRGGVGKAHIIDGRIEHSVLLEVFTDVGIGTQIVSE